MSEGLREPNKRLGEKGDRAAPPKENSAVLRNLDVPTVWAGPIQSRAGSVGGEPKLDLKGDRSGSGSGLQIVKPGPGYHRFRTGRRADRFRAGPPVQDELNGGSRRVRFRVTATNCETRTGVPSVQDG